MIGRRRSQSPTGGPWLVLRLEVVDSHAGSWRSSLPYSRSGAVKFDMTVDALAAMSTSSVNTSGGCFLGGAQLTVEKGASHISS